MIISERNLPFKSSKKDSIMCKGIVVVAQFNVRRYTIFYTNTKARLILKLFFFSKLKNNVGERRDCYMD